jgi:hypothetical protein
VSGLVLKSLYFSGIVDVPVASSPLVGSSLTDVVLTTRTLFLPTVAPSPSS